jgi:hypothetical protein
MTAGQLAYNDMRQIVADLCVNLPSLSDFARGQIIELVNRLTAELDHEE